MAGGGGGGSIGGYVPPVSPLTQAQSEALGYAGGALLALCLLPQIYRLAANRSARDVSAAWSVLYFAGLALTFVYLYFQGAVAAWVPLTVEMAGCVVILGLKIAFDCTPWGKRQGALAAARRRARREQGRDSHPAGRAMGAGLAHVPSAAVVADRRAVLAVAGVADAADGDSDGDVEAADAASSKGNNNNNKGPAGGGRR